MTPKEKKEWLLDAVGSGQRVDELVREAERVRARAERAGASWDSVGHASGFSASRVEACAVRLAELETIMLEQMEAYALRAAAAFVAIEALESPSLRRLMHLRYFGGLTWEKIAEEMGVDVRTCTRMHGRALLALVVPDCMARDAR